MLRPVQRWITIQWVTGLIAWSPIVFSTGGIAVTNASQSSTIMDTWQRLTTCVTDEQRRPAVSFLAQTAMLLLLFLCLNRVFISSVRITEEDYFAPILLLRFLSGFKPVLFTIAISIPLVLGWKRLRWEALGPDRTLQIFVCVLVFTIAWTFSLYEYNFYLNRGHCADRLILAGLAVLSVWRPGFVPLFLLQAFLLAGQFDCPLRNFKRTDVLVLFEVLIAWTGYAFIKLILPRFSVKPFALLAFCLLASQYFFSAVAKFELGGWLSENDIVNLFMAAHDNGLWAFCDGESVQSMGRTISTFNQPLKFVTVVLEAGVIVALLNRWILAAFFFGLAMMHVGIVFTSGIFFWKWMVLDFAIVFLWFRLGTQQGSLVETNRFNRYLPFALSVVIILASSHLWKSATLGWWDTAVSGVFRVEVVSENGAVQEVVPADFAPFDYPFAQGRFFYLDNRKNLVGSFGTTVARDRFDALTRAQTPADIVNYKQTLGLKESTDNESILRYEKFMRRFFGNMNERRGSGNFFDVLAPPQHIWTYPIGGTQFRWSEPIAKVRVRYTETFFDGEQSHVFSDKLVKEIEIPTRTVRNTPGAKS
jgi:hypothetical protein